MRHKHAFLLCTFAFLSISATLVACGERATVTATPAGAAAASLSGCTPTPAVRSPTFTLPPGAQYTPGAVGTSIARYQLVHPGDVIDPTQIVDLDPQVPQNQKWQLFVQLPGCIYETVLTTAAHMDNFKKTLTAGQTIVGVAPPQSAFEAPVLARSSPSTPGTSNASPGVPPGTVLPPPPAMLTAAAHQRETFTAGGRGVGSIPSGTPATPTR